MRRFYAPPEQFSGQNIELGLEETRHLRNVLRLREGDEINVFDGEGREFLCKVEQIEKKRAGLIILSGTDPSSPESSLELNLAAGLLKGDKFDLVVQKSVELGISRIQPLFTKRCDVRSNAGNSKIERWRKIALEAAKQSGRAKLMPVDVPVEFEDFIRSFESSPADGESRILFTERAGKGLANIQELNKITAVVGPEGGWDDDELSFAKSYEFDLVTLGGRILRTETAAISIAAILQHRFGDLS